MIESYYTPCQYCVCLSFSLWSRSFSPYHWCEKEQGCHSFITFVFVIVFDPTLLLWKDKNAFLVLVQSGGDSVHLFLNSSPGKPWFSLEAGQPSPHVTPASSGHLSWACWVKTHYNGRCRQFYTVREARSGEGLPSENLAEEQGEEFSSSLGVLSSLALRSWESMLPWVGSRELGTVF